MRFVIDLCSDGLPEGRIVERIEYRNPCKGEWFFSMLEGNWCMAHDDLPITRNVAVFQQVETWRAATIEDAIQALKGAKLECRFWNCIDVVRHHNGFLGGARFGAAFPWSCNYHTGGFDQFRYCEIKEMK